MVMGRCKSDQVRRSRGQVSVFAGWASTWPALCAPLLWAAPAYAVVSAAPEGQPTIQQAVNGTKQTCSAVQALIIGINLDSATACGPSATDVETTTTLAGAGVGGLYTSIAIGIDGLPIISYYDSTNGDLKIAHCDDLLCSSNSNQTLDSAGNVGLHTSITIGDDGLPIISHYDLTNGDLKIAHCDDLLCSSSSNQTLDSAGAVGFFTSIAIGIDGLPIISYYDSTNRDLEITHCENVTCSPLFRDGFESGDTSAWSSTVD